MQTSGGAEQVTQAKTVSEKGEVDGFSCKMELDISSMIQDSMDEVASMFEERTTKTMGEREVGIKNKMNANALAKSLFWIGKLPDMPGREYLMRLFRAIKQRDYSLKDLMEDLEKFSSDESHQFAALDVIETMLRGDDGNPQNPEDARLLDMVKQARAQLEEKSGPEIRAGINLSETIQQSGEPVEHYQQLRDLYRSEVLGFSTPQECFRSLVARGQGTLGKSLDFLLASCNVDMAAATPSTSTEELRRIMLDLQCVNVLRQCVEKFDNLSLRMMNEFSNPLSLNGEGMTGRMLDFTEMSVLDSGTMEQFTLQCGVQQLLAKLDFTRETSSIFRQLSDRLFRDNEGRSRMLDALQEYIDELVRQDEENRSQDEKQMA